MTASLTDSMQLSEFIGQYQRLFILTGAGVSTGSGVPAYRDQQGRWLAREPIKHQAFLSSQLTRQRYWARSLVGWPKLKDVQPNALHRSLVNWQALGRVALLVTQNVDGLHRLAGSTSLVELHGRIDRVVCLSCGSMFSRADIQPVLESHNRDFLERLNAVDIHARPDGDAEFGGVDYSGLVCPPCGHCGGTLMPDVVFFGGNVPASRVQRSYEALCESDAVLVIGSSLTVYSGYRFCQRAQQLGKPIAIVNWGSTRADDLAALKIEADCVELIRSVEVTPAPEVTEVAIKSDIAD